MHFPLEWKNGLPQNSQIAKATYYDRNQARLLHHESFPIGCLKIGKQSSSSLQESEIKRFQIFLGSQTIFSQERVDIFFFEPEEAELFYLDCYLIERRWEVQDRSHYLSIHKRSNYS